MKHAPVMVGLVVGVGALMVCAPWSSANPDWSGCSQCHGDFRDSNYMSPSDGQDWGNLHNVHRSDMLSGDCNTCHGDSGFSPVLIGASAGGAGLDPIGCVGCHGREQDMGNDSISPGRGAGLRQHHFVSGVESCLNCHSDSSPANYTPVGEDVLPSYYFQPDAAHPDKPTDPCNVDLAENFAGLPQGLDNNGDGVYDNCDDDCPEDLDGSGDVGFADLTSLLGSWGPCPMPPAECPADFDGSGDVGFADLTQLLGSWGPC
jgi:hypothetical protein